MKLLFASLSIVVSSLLFSQNPIPINGVANPGGRIYAITDAIIHPEAGKSFTGTVLFQEGKILRLGPNLTIPAEAIRLSFPGRHVYPGMVELWSDAGLPEVNKPRGRRDLTERSNRGVSSWNTAVHPEYSAANEFEPSEGANDVYRRAGIVAVCSHQQDGLFRGNGLLFAPGRKSSNELTIRNNAGQFFSFSKGSSMMDYPSSLMGSIALIRQTYLDLDWYKRGGRLGYKDISLEALDANFKLPSFFETSNPRDISRIINIGKEANTTFFMLGSGQEYQILDEVVRLKPSLILPLVFPEGWDLSDAQTSKNLSLAEMWHWEASKANAAILYKKGIEFTFTSAGLKSPLELISKLASAVEAGLPAQEALKAVTQRPAEWLGVDAELGSIAQGKRASFMIWKDTLFSKGNVLEMLVLDGETFPMNSPSLLEPEGNFTCAFQGNLIPLKIERNGLKLSLIIDSAGVIQKTPLLRDGDRVNFNWKPKGATTELRFNGSIHGTPNGEVISGNAFSLDGNSWPFQFTKDEMQVAKEFKADSIQVFTADSFITRYPFHSFGRTKVLETETVLFRGATVWTVEGDEPYLGDVLIQGGKIVAIGKELNPTSYLPKGVNPKIIDANGKHITPGIIDEHSHIAIERGVNEGTQNNTAEVRIGDVIYPEDPAIYIQLAGGVTSAQLLHGSANPIGGQSAVIKLRWGASADEMKQASAPGHIKFALGENVKQSNWGDQKHSRFPQTRMGVEQVYYDAFQRAIEYAKESERWEKASAKERASMEPFRKDLELEALVEILKGDRFITCHSYVQSEVNMLMHVADSMGFKVNTFTHILEGYKVADKMAAHGVNASTFSDWWAYKFEVNDAIPYNAAILTQMKVNSGINSDDTEMGRRLNQEAAKAILYGGLTETEALKLVTINPAKMLHIDSYTGSLKVGKDADLVVWSASPLSVLAKVESTWIDGKCFYSQQENEQLKAAIQAERTRLISRLVSNPQAKQSKKPGKQKRHEFHCDDTYAGELMEMEVAE